MFLEAYNAAAKTLLNADNLTNFYFLLAGQIDGSVLDEVWHKLAGMFLRAQLLLMDKTGTSLQRFAAIYQLTLSHALLPL